MTVNKRARMRLSVTFLAHAMKKSYHGGKLKSTAPDDLRVIGVIQRPDDIGTYFEVVLESNSFRPIVEGQELPLIDPFTYYREVPRD